MHALALLILIASPDWLVIGPTGTRGRRPFNPDAVFRRYLLDPAAAPPKAGDTVKGKVWKAVQPDKKGRISGRFRYAYTVLESARDRIVLARLNRGGTLFVNGDGYSGNIYGGAFAGVPVPLKKGANHVYVRGARGGFKLVLEDIEEGIHVSDRDATMPDRVSKGPMLASLVVFNASAQATARFAPFGVRRQAVPAGGLNLRVRKPDEVRIVTFRSSIDGTVQQYGVRPPSGEADGLVLTLHGAGVNPRGQARSYSAHANLWVVAPTNRRPFGFDWQDWGRKDAYEVLDDAMRRHPAVSPDRIYLTGHSMGGHGTWHLAANDPDRWAAIAPSAGWSSFDSYGGRPGGKHDALWRGADGASLTMNLLDNLIQLPTFVLHGEKDNNVPASEAHKMLKALKEAGGTPLSHFEPNKGHWWNGPAAKGADCVDWPGIFELFAKSRRKKDPDTIDFISVDPGVDANHHWIRVAQPVRYGELLRVKARRTEARIEVETTNVRRFRGPRGAYRIDGDLIAGEWFLKTDAGWTAAKPPAHEKSPARSGPFKRAFDNRFVFVYGDEVSMKRARYDAQVWWYRANGDVAVVRDERFLAGDYKGRNVILYGNADTNRAWSAVLSGACPVQVKNGALSVGERSWKGDGLGCVFVYPRRDGEGMIGAFGHTGEQGARLGYGLLTFISGVGYPDYAAFSAEILDKGDEGVLAAGWFSHDWTRLQR